MKAHYYDGDWHDGRGEHRKVLNPFDRGVIAEFNDVDAATVERAIDAARTAFDSGSWRWSPPRERASVLRAMGDLVETHREELVRTETLDTGKTIGESQDDIDNIRSVLGYYASLIEVGDDRLIRSPRETLSHVVQSPIGVCALIAPWNYPLMQMIWKLAPALAAGNTVVMKPSEIAPLSTIRFTELLSGLDIPPGVVNLVVGPGWAGEILASHPAVDMVSFTGSLTAGVSVMRNAAATVKRTALELGGKNPNIIFGDADIDAAVDNTLTGAFLHSGQVCSAGSRVLVEESIQHDFVDVLAARARRVRLGNGLEPETESGPLISVTQRDRVARLVSEAVAHGARVVVGGGTPTSSELAAGCFFEPTVLTDCETNRIAREVEVFGPVITIERFNGTDEAVKLADSTPFGLAAAVWSHDRVRARSVADRIRFGTVWINDFHPYFAAAEWGGMKQSGNGRELGPTGLREFTELKHIFENLAPRPTGWFGRS